MTSSFDIFTDININKDDFEQLNYFDLEPSSSTTYSGEILKEPFFVTDEKESNKKEYSKPSKKLKAYEKPLTADPVVNKKLLNSRRSKKTRVTMKERLKASLQKIETLQTQIDDLTTKEKIWDAEKEHFDKMENLYKTVIADKNKEIDLLQNIVKSFTK